MGGGVAAGVGGKIVTGGGGCFIITVDPFIVKSVGGFEVTTGASGGAPFPPAAVGGAAVEYDDDDGGVDVIPPVEDLELVVVVSVLFADVKGATVFGGVGVAVAVLVGGVTFPPDVNGDIGGTCNSAPKNNTQIKITHFNLPMVNSQMQSKNDFLNLESILIRFYVN